MLPAQPVSDAPLIVALSILAAVLFLLAFARFWVMVLSPDSIQGSDLHMLKWCLEEGRRAWGGFHLSFEDDADFEDIKRVVKSNIAADMENPKSTYRRGCDLEARRYVFYDDYTVDDVVEETSSDRAFFHLEDDRNRELVYRLHNRRKLLGALFDHTVWDGVRMFNETLTPAIQSTPFDSRWLVRDRYIPVLAELMILYTLVVMFWRWLTHDPLPQLSEGQRQHILRHKFDKADVSALKARAGCKFTSALLATWAVRLFEALPPERTSLRFGLIVGMNNPRFRNNYSILTVDVRREDDAATMAQAIQRQVKRRSLEVLPLYHLISFVELQTLFKQTMVDCLFSPAVFDRGEGPSAKVRDLFFYIVPTSMPLYCFACSIGDEITVSTTHNCPEVSLEQLASDSVSLYTTDDDKVIVTVPPA